MNNYSLFLFDKENFLRIIAKLIVKSKHFMKIRILILWLISVMFGIDTIFIEEFDQIENQNYHEISEIIQIFLFSALLLDIMLGIISEGMIFQSEAFFQTSKNVFFLTTTFSFFLKFHFQADKGSVYAVQ